MRNTLMVTLMIVVGGDLQAQGSKGDGAAVIREVNLKRHAERVAKLRADETKERIALARAAFSKKLVDQGIAVLKTVLAEDSENAEAHAELEKIPSETTPPAADAIKAFESQQLAWGRTAAKRRADLAKWCASQGLLAEGKDAYEAAVVFDAECKDAREALGFVKLNNAWYAKDVVALVKRGLVPHGDVLWVTPEMKHALDRGFVRVGNQDVSLTEADASRSQWPDVWDLRSRHYHMVSNLGFDEIVGILRLLEKWRGTVLDLFGPKLPKPQEVQEIRWARTLAEIKGLCPSINFGNAGENGFSGVTLYVCTDPDWGAASRCPRIAFECIAQLSEGSSGAAAIGSNPGFVFYLGIADSMEAISFSDGRWQIDRARLKRFKAESQKIQKLGPGVLDAMIGATSADGGRIYGEWWSAVITLTAYLFEGGGVEMRQDLINFIAAIVRGEGDLTLFRKTFSLTNETLHKDWNAWVNAL